MSEMNRNVFCDHIHRQNICSDEGLFTSVSEHYQMTGGGIIRSNYRHTVCNRYEKKSKMMMINVEQHLIVITV